MLNEGHDNIGRVAADLGGRDTRRKLQVPNHLSRTIGVKALPAEESN